jgi:hypothetical protein
MATLTVWCIDKANVVTRFSETIDELQALFDLCLKHQRYFDGVDIYFPQYRPVPENTDLVVYYLASPDSVAFVLDEKADSYVSEDSGQTAWSTGGSGKVLQYCSEVHVGSIARSNPRALAKLTFHEFMHNKLKVGDSLHSRGGVAGKSVGPDTKLTTQNAKDFGQALIKQHVQWIDGYDGL